MAEPGAGPIRNVSDTALWVAYYRAMESERPDALFRDRFARRLAGERGEAIVHSMPHGRSTSWPMVVRTVVMDEMILRLAAAGADALLDLAAGLDARPWRLDLPAGFHWYDADLPDMLAYKREHLAGEPARCAYEAREADLADPAARRALLADVAARHRRVIVLTEGLLVYLEPADVAGLASDLAAHAAYRDWITDLASPAMLRMLAKTWAPRLRAAGAPMKFAPAEGTGFFAAHGWREAEYRPMWEESLRLRRTAPLAWLWTFLGRFASPARRREMKRFSGMVRLERDGTPAA